MSRMKLRHLPRISYFEPEEPDWDEHVFCERCADYVYEYCSLHGPLLVVPDDKVPAKSPYPAYVPRAALTVPRVFLHIARSDIPGAGLGIFSTLPLPRGVRFGPYGGTKTTEIASNYCWQVFDRAHRPSHVVDAQDANRSNWMRYVNCARHSSEQNLVAYQYRGQVYYRTIKMIPKFTELLVFYGGEFACMLGVDLSLYNAPLEHARKIIELRRKRKAEEERRNAKQKKTIETNKENNAVVKPHKKSSKSFNAITVNVPNNNLVPESNLDISNNAVNAVEEIAKPVADYNEQNNIVSKTSCECCSKESQDEICTQCTPKVVALVPCNKLDNTRENETNVANGKKVLEKKHSCDTCQKKFVSKADLIRHLRIHTGEKPYKCDICQYKSSRMGTLKTHIKQKHTKEMNFKCHICEYKCVSKATLNIHLRIHTGEKPYKCDICQYTSSVMSSLKTHIKQKHTKEMNFKCHICEYKCVRKDKLNIHLRIHTGEKPYKCDICQYTSSVMSSLKTHIKQNHTKEMNFKCHICEYKCVRKATLNIHLRIHTGEKPFKCDFCQHRTAQSSSLKSHIMSKHAK